MENGMEVDAMQMELLDRRVPSSPALKRIFEYEAFFGELKLSSPA